MSQDVEACIAWPDKRRLGTVGAQGLGHPHLTRDSEPRDR
jgi:hypothetical protein